jgi:hypothetical protein
MWYVILIVLVLIAGAVWLSAASREVGAARARVHALRLKQRALFLRSKQISADDGKQQRRDFGRR